MVPVRGVAVGMSRSFRFLIIASAMMLWVGAGATAGEPAIFGDGQLPGISALLSAGGESAAAQAAGGEAPVDASQRSSGE